MHTHRKGGTTQLVIGAVALVVILGGIIFYLSDPFSTRVKAGYKQFTEWTPENIAKDPVNYLNFCEQKTTEAIQQLKADRISVAQSRAKLDEMKTEAANKVRIGNQKLVELRDAYQKAAADKSFPVSIGGEARGEEWFKSSIPSLLAQVKTQKTILDKVEAGLKKLEAQVIKIDKAQGDAQTQLAEISANRQLLSAQKLTEDLKDRLVSIKGAVQGVIDTAGSSDSGISLDALAAESGTKVDDADFAKMLNEIK